MSIATEAASPVVACALRPMAPGDVPFVLSSWLKSAADVPNGVATAFSRRVFFAEHERLVRESVLPRSRVLVASSPDDDEVIRGWVCVEEPPGGTMLHYLYVRFDWRGLGIAKQLLASVGPIALQTHRSRDENAYPYNPYPLFLGASWRPLQKLCSTMTLSTRGREPSAETESRNSKPIPS